MLPHSESAPAASRSKMKTPCRAASLTDAERHAMLGAIPNLRRFARYLTGNLDRADDLVQETLVRAIAKIDRFEPGSNMQAWLFTILRNLFLGQCRVLRCERAYKSSPVAGPMSAPPAQYVVLQARELQDVMQQVPVQQREALLLTSVYGHSYDEAAAVCRCPVGTVKSRANRARVQLAKLMAIDHASDFGPDRRDLAVVG